MRILLCVVAVFWTTSAHAYIGPGVGIGAIATVLAALASFFIAVFAIVYYPIKRMLKKKKIAKLASADNPEAPTKED